MGVVREPKRPGQVISMDFIGPINVVRNGWKYIMVIIDHLSRRAKVFASKKSTADDVGRNLNKWCQELRRPEIILSDNAMYYKSRKLMKWAEDRGVKLINIATYAHKSNGIVERYNQTLIGRIQ